MKLKLEIPVNSLAELDLLTPQKIYLFGKYNKSVSLFIDEGFFFIVEYKENGISRVKRFLTSQKEEAQAFYDQLYVVPKEITADFEKFKDFILNCEVEVYYQIDFFSYNDFHISKSFTSQEYSWGLGSKSGIFNKYPPAKQKGYIQQFATVENAKKRRHWSKSNNGYILSRK